MVRQLLNHTSGIYSFTSLPQSDDNERRDLTHDQVLALIKDKPLDFEPGSQWRYDNSGFYIAGMIVERVTGEEYGAYLQEHIFKPLGMTASSLCDARMVVPHLASGYEVERGAFVNAAFLSWKLPFAAGSICSTASDLVRWQTAMNGGHVIAPASLTLMRTPTTLADGASIDYGLGTRLGMLDGHRIAGHTGTGGGYASVMETFPDDHLTIVVLTNTGSGMQHAVSMARAIAREVLHLPAPPLRDLPVPNDERAALIGRYESEEGPVEVFEGEGKLHFRIAGPGVEGTQQRQTALVYAIDEDVEVRFLVRDGHATWAQVYQDGLFADAKRWVP
jgi:CubicO group peptidase (beta-lactamase class C family)